MLSQLLKYHRVTKIFYLRNCYPISQFNLGSCRSGILSRSVSQSLHLDMASTSKPYALGFVGLGNMGSQMARNLSVYAKLNGLSPLRLWNRTRSKTEPLAQEIYSEIVSTLEEMAEKCDIVHTCLANDEVALSLYRQFFDTKSAGTIFADHSTLYPTTATLFSEKQKWLACITCLVQFLARRLRRSQHNCLLFYREMWRRKRVLSNMLCLQLEKASWIPARRPPRGR